MDSAPDAAPCAAGCPIRRPRDQSPLAAPPGLSQRAASFIASRRLGIHRVPFSRSPRPGGRAAGAEAPRPLQSPRTTNERTRATYPYAARRHNTSRMHTRRARHRARARASSRRRTMPKNIPPPRTRRGAPPPPPLVGPGRLERPTSRLSGARSNRLSYGPGPAGVAGLVAARGGECSGKGRAGGAPGADAAAAPAGAWPRSSLVDGRRRDRSRRP